MRYAPQPWLCKLAVLVDWDVAQEIGAAGRRVYMMLSVLDPGPYFGQCRAIRAVCAVIARFADEINGTRACTPIHGTKAKKIPMYAQLLRKLGPHTFSIIPIRRTTLHNTHTVEIWHVCNVLPNMNTPHSKRRQYYSWHQRGNIRNCMPVGRIRQKAVWHNYMQVNASPWNPLLHNVCLCAHNQHSHWVSTTSCKHHLSPFWHTPQA